MMYMSFEIRRRGIGYDIINPTGELIGSAFFVNSARSFVRKYTKSNAQKAREREAKLLNELSMLHDLHDIYIKSRSLKVRRVSERILEIQKELKTRDM